MGSIRAGCPAGHYRQHRQGQGREPARSNARQVARQAGPGRRGEKGTRGDRGMTLGLSLIELEDGQPTRLAFGEALADAGANERIVVLDGDVHNSTYTGLFGDRFPDRFFNVGIAESNLVGIAAGLAGSGKIPVVSSFSIFLLANAFDQIRMSIAFPNQNVKLVGTHAGISIGEDGPSQMGIEDVALACALPGFTVIVPADGASTRAATAAMLEREGPTFLRCGRPAVPVIYENGTDFHVGKANEVREGSDITIIANGIMVAMALDAAERAPTRMAFVDIGDTYATSGKPQELLRQFGLTPEAIADQARHVLKV